MKKIIFTLLLAAGIGPCFGKIDLINNTGREIEVSLKKSYSESAEFIIQNGANFSSNDINYSVQIPIFSITEIKPIVPFMSVFIQSKNGEEKRLLEDGKTYEITIIRKKLSELGLSGTSYIPGLLPPGVSEKQEIERRTSEEVDCYLIKEQ